MATSLADWLQECNCEDALPCIAELGAISIDDLLLLETADLEAVKRELRPLAQKRLDNALARFRAAEKDRAKQAGEAEKARAKHLEARRRGSVAEWMSGLQLGVHSDALVAAGFDTVDSVLHDLTAAELAELDIPAPHVKRIMRHIREESAPRSPDIAAGGDRGPARRPSSRPQGTTAATQKGSAAFHDGGSRTGTANSVHSRNAAPPAFLTSVSEHKLKLEGGLFPGNSAPAGEFSDLPEDQDDTEPSSWDEFIRRMDVFLAHKQLLVLMTVAVAYVIIETWTFSVLVHHGGYFRDDLGGIYAIIPNLMLWGFKPEAGGGGGTN
jgi:hypothetical protein